MRTAVVVVVVLRLHFVAIVLLYYAHYGETRTHREGILFSREGAHKKKKTLHHPKEARFSQNYLFTVRILRVVSYRMCCGLFAVVLGVYVVREGNAHCGA